LFPPNSDIIEALATKTVKRHMWIYIGKPKETKGRRKTFFIKTILRMIWGNNKIPFFTLGGAVA
jgi:hypothetical protein